MLLKSIELFGFKTFADRTRLEFGSGITGIVGPNGAGKSNIADALLFILGEQSNKAIRAGQITDVIFHGNASRKPMGIAEVTIALDNSDGSLALPYQEVAIARRSHRNGESDYFINRTKCRLRDIQDLFLDTGLGKGAYSMIGQNEVDRILSLRADDRRILFEEAAGTAKYRARRNETLRKLEQTEDHLTRINDVYTEVVGQLRPLANQAEQAREHRELVAQFRELAVSVFAAEAAQARQTVGRCEHELFVLRADIERFDAEAAELEVRASGSRESLADAEEKLADAQRRNGLVQAAVSRAEADIAVAEERLRSCRDRSAMLDQEGQAIVEEAEANRTQSESLARQLAEGRSRLDEVTPKEQAASAKLSSLQEELETLTASLAQVGDAERALVARRAALEAELANLRAQRRDADDRLREVDLAVARLTAQERSEHERQAKAEEELDTLAARESALATALDSARDRSDQSQSEVEQLLDERSAARNKVGAAEARLASLDEIGKAGGHLPRGVRSLLQARADNDVSGLAGTVSDVIGVPPELERAISAALGEWSRAVVAETEEGAWAAVHWLQESRGGYAMVLPLDTLQAPPDTGLADSIVQREGVVGRAADLVSFHPRRRSLIERLLGAVVVVRDVDTARSLRAFLGARGMVVTLTGERMDHDGTIAGGSEPGASEDPILLATARDRALADRDAATRALDEVDERIAGARGLHETAIAQAAEAEQGYRECIAEIQTAGTRSAVTEERIRGLRAQREQHEAERNTLTIAIGEFDRKLAARTEDLTTLCAVPGAAPMSEEDRVVALAQDAARVRAEVEEARLLIREFTARTDEAGRELAALERQQARGASRLEAIGADRGALAESEEAAEARIADAKERLADARREGATLLEETRRLSDLRLAALRDIEEAGRLAVDARGQVSRMREDLSGHEVKRARAEEHLESIRSRLSEEFGLVLTQAEHLAKPLGGLDEARVTVRSLRARIAQMGTVNTAAEEEWGRLSERERFLAEQKADLEAARDNLGEIIAEIDNATKVQFLEAFNAIADQFRRIFRFFFYGGDTQLILTDPDNLLETGVDIVVKAPGHAKQTLAALSGGERSLTAMSLLFAMLRVRPAPFCLLDEIDAALDETNTERFANLLHQWTDQTQFLVITHAPGTMQGCDRLYGVTMQEDGVSYSLSIALEEAEDVIEGRRPVRSARDVLFAPKHPTEAPATEAG